MKTKAKYIYFVVLLALPFQISAQTETKREIEKLFKKIDEIVTTEYHTTIKYLDTLEELVKKVNEPDNLVRFYITKGKLHNNFFEFESADQYYKKAERELNKKFQLDNYLNLLLSQADCYTSLNRLDEAFTLCNKAISHFSELKNIDLKTKCYAYSIKGNILMQQNDTTSFNFLRLAEDLALKLKWNELLGRINYDVAVLYKKIRNYEQAIYHCKQAKLFFKEKNPNISIVYNVWAQALLGQRKVEEAEKMYIKMISDSLILSRNKIFGLNSYGILLKESGRYKEAEKLFQEGLQISREINHKMKEGEFLANIGSTYFEQNDFEKAFLYLTKAKVIFFDPSLNTSMENKMYLVEMIIQTGINGKREAPLFDQYIALRDSFDDFNTFKIQTHYATKFETEKKKREIIELTNKNFIKSSANLKLEELNSKLENEKLTETLKNKKQNQINDSLNFLLYLDSLSKKTLIEKHRFINDKINQQKKILVLIILSLFSVGLLAFILFKQSNQRKLANIKITQQKDKIQLLNRELNHRVKNNLAFMTSLLEMQSRRTENIETRHALQESESRLRTIALVHSQLFKNEAEKEINLKTYIQEIAAHLQNLFSTQDKPLQIIPEVIDYNINAEDAMRIGLIVNELVTNSVKHANNLGSTTQLKVKTTITPEGILKLEYFENGNPFNGTLSNPIINTNVQSLGLKLIDLLKQQLGDQYIIVC